MKATVTSLTRSMEGEYLLTLATRDRCVETIYDDMRDKPLRVEIKVWRERRSLDANAYFHVLVNRIAAVTGQSDSECKRHLVLDYGTLDRDADGKVAGAKLPASIDVQRYFPYAKEYAREIIQGREYIAYVFYKPTHELDTKEMSRLIDGTVFEARQLGIETMPPQELAAMEAAWGT